MLDLIFVTSNNTKLAHARFLCRDYTVNISKQKQYGVGYNEPRIQDRDLLLADSVKDAFGRLQKKGKNTDEGGQLIFNSASSLTINLPYTDNIAHESFFFIEDTSVIVHALSKERETPGVDVKYWMQEINFETLDNQLRLLGNDRSVTVRSDVILVLPNSLQRLLGIRDKRFTSSVQGTIVNQEFPVRTQALYPWLDSISFNKWFIPDGADRPLSMLPIAEAEKNDFRAGAFKQMLEFLQAYHYIRRRDDVSSGWLNLVYGAKQGSLFRTPLLFVICGPTCAGKSTLADFLTTKYNYYHIEASDYMHLSYYRAHGVDPFVRISDFAQNALSDNPLIVVDQILRRLSDYGDIPVIITGFRSPKEVLGLRQMYKGTFGIELVYIEANDDIRYERSLRRGRSDLAITREKFDSDGIQQIDMGLAEIGRDSTANHIQNNDTMGNFFNEFLSQYEEDLYMFKLDENRSINPPEPIWLEDWIILSLYEKRNENSFFTTAEIARVVNQFISKINNFNTAERKSKNNISRYFNQYFHPFYEINPINHKRRYRLSQSGIGHARWLLNNPGRHQPPRYR